MSPGAVEDTIDRAVMEGLFRYDADGKLQPQLAETYTVSPDGLTIDFTLHKGVMWQRGYGELTMDDVKFSYERFLVKDPKPAYADDWSSLDHVEIVDKYTGKLVFKQPQATLWTTVLPMTSGLIVCKKFYDRSRPGQDQDRYRRHRPVSLLRVDAQTAGGPKAQPRLLGDADPITMRSI